MVFTSRKTTLACQKSLVLYIPVLAFRKPISWNATTKYEETRYAA